MTSICAEIHSKLLCQVRLQNIVHLRYDRLVGSDLGRGCEELGLGNACPLNLACQEFIIGGCNKGEEGGIEGRCLDRYLRVLTTVCTNVLIDGIIAEGVSEAIGIEDLRVLLYNDRYEGVIKTTEGIDKGCNNFIRYGGTIVSDLTYGTLYIEQEFF